MESIKQLYTKVKTRTVGSHELSSVYFKQVSATSIIKFVSVVISLIYVPIVLGFLDQTKYGIWVTLTTIVNWIRLADIGVGGGMRLKLSEAIALKDYQKGRIHVSTTYGIIGGIFLLVLTVFYFVNPYLDWQSVLNTSIISQSELVRLTTITVSFVVIGFILKTVNQVYLAHGNSTAESLIHLITSSVSLFLIWVATIWADKGNLILLATIVTGIPVLVYVIATVYTYFYRFPHFRPSFKLIKLSESRSLMVLSLQSFVSSFTFLIIYGSVPFVVAHLFSPNEVTIFNIAYSMFNLPIMIISLVVMPIKPLITLAYTKKDYNWIRLMQKKLNKMSLMIVAGTIIMIIFNQFIYHIWIGDKVTIPFILSASIGVFAIINILQFSNSIIVLGTGKMIINAILSPINIGLFLTLSIVLSKLLNNVIGVSIALTVTCLVPLIVYPLWLKKIMPVH
ncbi:MAG: hypothetical protein MUO72_10025 [Bacteroidales bacterium]|nr:hypothetical protein [Bacteroidales bacterium]